MALNNSQLFINNEFPFIRNMSKIAAKIAFYNFEWRYVTLVMFNNIKLIGLATFLRNYNQSVQLKLGEFIPQRRFGSVQQFVLFAQEASEITGMLRWLAKNQYDTTGKYIIMCYSIESENCGDKEIFETLSSVFIVNVLLIRGSFGDKEPTVSSYFLVLPEKCLNSEPVQLNISLNCHDDSCFKSAYPEKFSNMYKCPFIVSTFEQHPFMYLRNNSPPGGKDGDLLTLVVDILNASLVIKTPTDGSDWGEFVNNNWTGSLGEVFNDVAHAAMCSAPLSPDKYANFQISFTYSSMDIVWAADMPNLKPAWEKLLYPLGSDVRVLIFFIFVGIVFINTFTKTRTWRKVIKVLKISPPKSNLLFYSWVIFMGLPVSKTPSKPSLLILIGIWVWFCFVIRTVYQAALISILKQNIYDEPFYTFQDILDTKKPFGGIAVYKEYYSDDSFIYDNYIVMNLAEGRQVVDSISNGSLDFAIAMNRETVYFRLIKYKGTRHLQIIPEKIANSPTVIFFKKFSHLTAPVSRILSASLEGGFSERLYARFYRKGITILQNSKEQRREALRLQHFMGSFFTLLGGYVVSVIFFAVEVICGRIVNSQH
ncbi:uncharacterized protein LOC125224641 [Leguminivora glycinivorella]|uniref:uncharacterized protein LOC125224641 n=1 Tax=Leguminivora glycinivorella TaxID=1035111 RepID=UPI00200D64AD|nr:uncharacterized protein LOC125224641 [Leguminivora glycinivorella]